MKVFQDKLWGYELSYPQDWVHHAFKDVDGFAASYDAFNTGSEDQNTAHLLMRAELNWVQKPVEALWKIHIGKVAGLIGARRVGSAPWHMAGAPGFEAEIQLPKKAPNRLWVGILANGLSVFQLMVTHPKDQRETLEPVFSEIIKSLRFIDAVPDLQVTSHGVPLPPGYLVIDPADILRDITNPDAWQGYTGSAAIEALQAFFTREAPNFGWQIKEYVPFPSSSGLGFARFRLEKGGETLVLGLIPNQTAEADVVYASIVIQNGS